jgi:hypothetical protein
LLDALLGHDEQRKTNRIDVSQLSDVEDDIDPPLGGKVG